MAIHGDILSQLLNEPPVINEIYEKLNTIFDLQKKYLEPKTQFKMGVRNLYQLSTEQYDLLIKILKSI